MRRAIREGDKEALVALVDKGRALYLKKATRIVYADFDAVPGTVYVAIRSGAEVGEDCFMPKGWVAP